MNATRTALALLLTALTACSAEPPPEQPRYEIVANMHQTMEWILEPAVDVLWDSAGFIIDAEGETDLAPTNDAEWNRVMAAAVTLTEAANLLMLPGRAAPEYDWIEYSRGLVDAGKLAIAAAEAQDADALFDAGGRIYQVCRACHNQYWPEARDD